LNNNHDREFDSILLDSIDSALGDLGETVKNSIYFHLKNKFTIAREDIPHKIAEFSDALEQIFGIGARHLEILFMKKIHAKLDTECSWPAYKYPLSKWIVPEMTFQQYVQLMRKEFEEENKNKLEIGIIVNEHEELQH
jgi:hypothetical protein